MGGYIHRQEVLSNELVDDSDGCGETQMESQKGFISLNIQSKIK